MSKKRIERIHELTGIVLDGLNGNTFSWGDGQRTSWVPILREIGITLITKTQIQKRGLVLKRGAKPVGTAYFGAPIKRYADLYVLEVQCTKPKKPDTDCWLFLDCEIVTGKPLEKCPNRKQCKQNALHSSNRKCELPFGFRVQDGKTYLAASPRMPEEAKSVGWHPAIELFYEYKDGILLIGKSFFGNRLTIPEEAKALGFAQAEEPCYGYSDNYLHVFKYPSVGTEFPAKFIEAGWYPAIDLPYYIHPDWGNWANPNSRKFSVLEVKFDVDAPERAETIAHGWYPAQKIKLFKKAGIPDSARWGGCKDVQDYDCPECKEGVMRYYGLIKGDKEKASRVEQVSTIHGDYLDLMQAWKCQICGNEHTIVYEDYYAKKSTSTDYDDYEDDDN